MSDAPSRWHQGGSDVPPGMQELLDSARRDLPNTAQLSALESKLGALLDTPPPAQPPTGPAPASTLPGATKLAVLVAVGGLIGAGAWWTLSADGKPPKASEHSSQASPQEPAKSKPLAPEPRTAPAPEQPMVEESTAEEISEQRPEPQPELQRPEPAKKPPSEAALLDQARRALKANPERALSLTKTHKRLFPNGALTQEREVIAIEALKRLDQTAKAKQKADRFSEQYPESAHQKKIDSTLKK